MTNITECLILQDLPMKQQQKNKKEMYKKKNEKNLYTLFALFKEALFG